MTLEEEILKEVGAAIEEVGADVPFSLIRIGDYDTDSGTVQNQPRKITVKAVVQEVNGKIFTDAKNEDKMLTVVASVFPRDPNQGDSFKFDGKIFTVAENGVRAEIVGRTKVVFYIHGIKS